MGEIILLKYPERHVVMMAVMLLFCGSHVTSRMRRRVTRKTKYSDI